MCRGAGGVGGRGEAGGAGGFLPFPRAPSRLSEAQAPKRSEGSQKAPQTASARRGGGRRVVFELPALVGIGARRMKEQPRNSKSTGTGSKPRGNGARPSPRGLCIPNLETPPRGPAVAGTIGCSRRSGHGLPGPVSGFKSLRELQPGGAPACRGRPVAALSFPVWDDAVVVAGRSLLVGIAAGPPAAPASAGIGQPVAAGLLWPVCRAAEPRPRHAGSAKQQAAGASAAAGCASPSPLRRRAPTALPVLPPGLPGPIAPCTVRR